MNFTSSSSGKLVAISTITYFALKFTYRFGVMKNKIDSARAHNPNTTTTITFLNFRIVSMSLKLDCFVVQFFQTLRSVQSLQCFQTIQSVQTLQSVQTNYKLPIICHLDQKTSQSHLNSHTSLTP